MHEEAHFLLGGGNLQWQGADWTCPSCSVERAQTIALAGFKAQALANETLLAFNSPREHPLVGGFMLWSIFNPIAHVIRSEQAGPECFGDLSNFRDLTQRCVLEGG